MGAGRLERGDWLVLGGIVILVVGMSLGWYEYRVEFAMLGMGLRTVSGWSSPVAIAGFVLALAGAVPVVVKAASGAGLRLPVRSAVITAGLGAAATICMIVSYIDKPGLTIHGVSVPYTATSVQAGVLVSLLGVAAVAAGGLINMPAKNAESATPAQAPRPVGEPGSFCSACGAPFHEDAPFCSSCGASRRTADA